MKCLLELEISLKDIFGDAPIDLGTYSNTVGVELYKCVTNSLLNEIEQYGFYETFYDAIDDVTDDEDDDDVLDAFIDIAKSEVIDIIKNRNLQITDCHIDYYDNFEITVDIDFEDIWKRFKENRK